MHKIYSDELECEFAYLRNQVRINNHIDIRVDKRFIIDYLEKIDECLYDKDYENCKKYLYDLYNWINVGHLFHELDDYDKNQHLYMDARKIPKVEEPIPPKMEEIKEDFNIFHFIKEIFSRRCK